ncbi:hypothetical protein [Dyella psychrodurans]|uniref:hypothetical protein n=1 Tax=Dyella psychrodurans TaxID=1927960 RepID=UPI000E1CDD1A|nr:hypothetical protein [Dyella psychrodurans]
MSDSATITREQVRTVYIATELGGKTGNSNHFSYAGLGSSSYSFGQLQLADRIMTAIRKHPRRLSHDKL